MPDTSRRSKLAPPPRWLFWAFLACLGALALRPSAITVWTVVPVVAANVIVQAWEWRARKARP
jgi:hypothetical protein